MTGELFQLECTRNNASDQARVGHPMPVLIIPLFPALTGYWSESKLLLLERMFPANTIKAFQLSSRGPRRPSW